MSLTVNIRRNLGTSSDILQPIQLLLDHTDLIIVLEDGRNAYKLRLNLAQVLVRDTERLALWIDGRLQFLQHKTKQAHQLGTYLVPYSTAPREHVVLSPLDLGVEVVLTGPKAPVVAYDIVHCEKSFTPHEREEDYPDLPKSDFEFLFPLLALLAYLFTLLSSAIHFVVTGTPSSFETPLEMSIPRPRKPLDIANLIIRG